MNKYITLGHNSFTQTLHSIFTICNRNKDNCVFGFVFTSNVVLDIEPKVSNYQNVALVKASNVALLGVSLGLPERHFDNY